MTYYNPHSVIQVLLFSQRIFLNWISFGMVLFETY